MRKILTPIIITTATFIAGCGSSNSSSSNNPNELNTGTQKTTWRLSSLDASYIQNNETIVHKGAVLYEYDSNNELIRTIEHAALPSDSVDLSISLAADEPTFVLDDKGQFTINEAAGIFDFFDQDSLTKIKVEINSLSPSHWLEEVFIYRPEYTELNSHGDWHLRLTNEFLDWGDSLYSWANIGDSWAGDNNSAPLEDVNDGTDMPTEMDSSPQNTQAENLFPKQHVIREYNSLGYLTYRAIYTEDQSQLLSEDILEYKDGSTLFKITTHVSELPISEQWTGDFERSDGEQILTYTHQYEFISESELKIVTQVSLNDNLIEQYTKAANYEQAPCGPITLERSKKAIARDFPVCIEK